MSARAKKVKPGSPKTVAEFLNAQIAISGVPQKDIAEALEYDKPNIITMIKQGKTKLPLEKVAPMAEVLGVDPIRLLHLVMSEYAPNTWDAIQGIVGFAVTEHERQLVEIFRKATGDTDPPINAIAKKSLESTFKGMITA